MSLEFGNDTKTDNFILKNGNIIDTEAKYYCM